MFVMRLNSTTFVSVAKTFRGHWGICIWGGSRSICNNGLGVLLRFCKTYSADPEPTTRRVKRKSLIKNYSLDRSIWRRTMEERNPSNVPPDNLALERLADHLPLAAIRHKGSGRFSIGRSSAQLVARMLDVLGFLDCKDMQLR